MGDLASSHWHELVCLQSHLQVNFQPPCPPTHHIVQGEEKNAVNSGHLAPLKNQFPFASLRGCLWNHGALFPCLRAHKPPKRHWQDVTNGVASLIFLAAKQALHSVIRNLTHSLVFNYLTPIVSSFTWTLVSNPVHRLSSPRTVSPHIGSYAGNCSFRPIPIFPWTNWFWEHGYGPTTEIA